MTPVRTDHESDWRALMAGERLAALVVTVAGVLLYAMNALLKSTVLPRTMPGH